MIPLVIIILFTPFYAIAKLAWGIFFCDSNLINQLFFVYFSPRHLANTPKTYFHRPSIFYLPTSAPYVLMCFFVCCVYVSRTHLQEFARYCTYAYIRRWQGYGWHYHTVTNQRWIKPPSVPPRYRTRLMIMDGWLVMIEFLICHTSSDGLDELLAKAPRHTYMRDEKPGIFWLRTGDWIPRWGLFGFYLRAVCMWLGVDGCKQASKQCDNTGKRFVCCSGRVDFDLAAFVVISEINHSALSMVIFFSEPCN